MSSVAEPTKVLNLYVWERFLMRKRCHICNIAGEWTVSPMGFRKFPPAPSDVQNQKQGSPEGGFSPEKSELV